MKTIRDRELKVIKKCPKYNNVSYNTIMKQEHPKDNILKIYLDFSISFLFGLLHHFPSILLVFVLFYIIFYFICYIPFYSNIFLN